MTFFKIWDTKNNDFLKSETARHTELEFKKLSGLNRHLEKRFGTNWKRDRFNVREIDCGQS